MQDDLYVPAARASALAANISAYLSGDPVEDNEWEEMMLRLEAIQYEFLRLLADNDMPTPHFPNKWDKDNPYLVPEWATWLNEGTIP